MASKQVSPLELTKYQDGLDNDSTVNETIAAIWASLIANEKEHIASVLLVPSSSLDPTKPPFRVETVAAGMTGGEVVVLFLGAVFGETVKDLGEEAGKALFKRASKLWRSRMAKRLQDPKHPALGEELDDESDE